MKEIVEGVKDLYPKKFCDVFLREAVSGTCQDCKILTRPTCGHTMYF